jgi:hypothetical protein
MEESAATMQRLLDEDIIQIMIEKRVNEIIEEKLKKKG